MLYPVAMMTNKKTGGLRYCTCTSTVLCKWVEGLMIHTRRGKMGAARSLLRWRKPVAPTPDVSRRIKRPAQVPPPEEVESEPPNEKLLERLRNVYVESTDTVISGKGQNLPQDRSYSEEDPLDKEVMVKEGRLTALQLRIMFDRARLDPDKWSPAAVAEEYKITAAQAENLLKYFGNFSVVAKREQPKLEFHPLHR